MDMRVDAFAGVRAEWERVCAAPRTGELVHGWLAADEVWAGRAAPAVGGLGELLAGLKRGGGQEFSDRWLGALLRRVEGTGFAAELAALMVVQAMSPAALKALRRLHAQYEVPLGEVESIVLASLYEVVRRYPLGRRPRKIALNIAWDTHRLASRELLREKERPPGEVELLEESARERVVAFEDAEHPRRCAERRSLARRVAAAGGGLAAYLDGGIDGLSGARGELAELLLWALEERVLEEEGVWVLAAHYREGAPADVEAARRAGVSAAAWRQRRSRAVRQLRAAAPQWLEQAA